MLQFFFCQNIRMTKTEVFAGFERWGNYYLQTFFERSHLLFTKFQV